MYIYITFYNIICFFNSRFFSDHNIDRSIEVLKKWITLNIKNYHSIESVLDEENTPIPGEEGVAHWPRERYAHIMDLREEAISLARHKWADYIWVILFIINISLFIL